MFSVQLITIGTEIVSGEIVNTNAAWLSSQLEHWGLRVGTHLSVRDQRPEILEALKFCKAKLVFVTGGLGPTSDDITRDCMAIHTGVPLDFDNQVWAELKALYERRALPLREAHRWQCHFPRGSAKLKNSSGTALGFHMAFGDQHYFVLPGPPGELQTMFLEEVVPLLGTWNNNLRDNWIRWTCLGVAESEVAEKVEPVIQGQGVEVGYRAHVPYVKVKVSLAQNQISIADKIDEALKPWIVARGDEDLAEQLLLEWPDSTLEIVDLLTGNILVDRMSAAQTVLAKKKEKIPGIKFSNHGELAGPGVRLTADGEEFIVKSCFSFGDFSERKKIPYKLPLNSERGKRSAAEWAIWTTLCALRARDSQN